MTQIDLGTPELLLELDEPLAWLTFNRPQARNAMTWAMYDGLLRACEFVDSRPSIRTFLLKGAGEQAFVAGTDISQFTAFRGAEDALAYEERMEVILRRLEEVRVPTIAAIRGYAVGAGAAIALACDLRVCSTDMQFGVPIARTLGNTLNEGNFRRLVAAVGGSRAKEIMFTARTMGAEEARIAGLANLVTAPEELRARAAALARTITDNAPLTVQSAKEAIGRIARGEPFDDGLVLRCYLSEDFREGVSAFLEKRRPVWQGK